MEATRRYANSDKIDVLDVVLLALEKSDSNGSVLELDELAGSRSLKILSVEPLPVRIASAPVVSVGVVLFSSFKARYFVTNC